MFEQSSNNLQKDDDVTSSEEGENDIRYRYRYMNKRSPSTKVDMVYNWNEYVQLSQKRQNELKFKNEKKSLKVGRITNENIHDNTKKFQDLLNVHLRRKSQKNSTISISSYIDNNSIIHQMNEENKLVSDINQISNPKKKEEIPFRLKKNFNTDEEIGRIDYNDKNDTKVNSLLNVKKELIQRNRIRKKENEQLLAEIARSKRRKIEVRLAEKTCLLQNNKDYQKERLRQQMNMGQFSDADDESYSTESIDGNSSYLNYFTNNQNSENRNNVNKSNIVLDGITDGKPLVDWSDRNSSHNLTYSLKESHSPFIMGENPEKIKRNDCANLNPSNDFNIKQLYRTCSSANDNLRRKLYSPGEGIQQHRIEPIIRQHSMNKNYPVYTNHENIRSNSNILKSSSNKCYVDAKNFEKNSRYNDNIPSTYPTNSSSYSPFNNFGRFRKSKNMNFHNFCENYLMMRMENYSHSSNQNFPNHQQNNNLTNIQYPYNYHQQHPSFQFQQTNNNKGQNVCGNNKQKFDPETPSLPIQFDLSDLRN